MILFIFEGAKREREIFRTIEELFFQKDLDRIICYYCDNIYHLYSQITDKGKITDPLYYDDIVTVLQRRGQNNSDSEIIKLNRSDISEVYLFFDYEIQNDERNKDVGMEELNIRLERMLRFFDDETNQGRLYINYPTVESIRYTKKLPDDEYYKYAVNISSLNEFKKIAGDFSFYGNLDFITYKLSKKGAISDKSGKKENDLRRNWSYSIEQNIQKANYITKGKNTFPEKKQDVCQIDIFTNHLKKYFPELNVPVLNSFPLFLYEYFDDSNRLFMSNKD